MRREGLSAFAGMLIFWAVGFCSLALFEPDPLAESCVYQTPPVTDGALSGPWYAYQDRSGKHTVYVRHRTSVEANC